MATHHELKSRKIIHIIPAVGWLAKYLDASDQSPDNYSPIACWALVEGEDGERWVEGLEATSDGLEFAENVSNFSEYVQHDQITEDTWYAKYQALVEKLDTDHELSAADSLIRERKVETLVDKMKESDRELYERLTNTPGFSYYFNQLVSIAQDDDALPEA